MIFGHRPRALATTGAALALLLLALLAGCGGDDSSSAGSSGGGQDIAQFKQRAERWYKGMLEEPPASGPKPEAGKKVWIISCGQSFTSCSLPVRYMQEAAAEIGWDTRVFDGKFDPSQFTAGMRQAIAAGADGIVVVGIDCPLIKSPLREAKEKGIAVVPNVAMDCDDPALDAGPSLFAANVPMIKGYERLSKFQRAWGAARADWLIAKTDGEAKVIDFASTDFAQAEEIRRGFEAELAKCKGCEIVDTVKFVTADYGSTVQQKTEQAIVKHPEANALIVNYNVDLEGGGAAAVRASGRSDSLLVGGGEGMPSDFEYFDQGIEDMIAYWNQEWVSWATIDTLNRAFAGDEAVPEGIGWILIDAEHNRPGKLPKSGLPPVPVDFKAGYRKAWGIG